MQKVYIIGACRTPIGRMGGSLRDVSAVKLGASAVKEAVKRAGIQPDMVNHVYMGCVLQAGLGQNVARQIAVEAGMPCSTTAETLNVVCGSGLDAVNAGARLIATNEADIVVAGGTENMSQAPFALMNGRFGYRMGSPMVKSELVDTMVKDALWDAINDYHMGVTAENVAERFNITREEMDAFSIASQNKAVSAIAEGCFKDEIVPIILRDKRKGSVCFDTDENPRANLTGDDLARLKPAFMSDGRVTAGNASSINDGAAAIVMIGADKLHQLGLSPMAKWLGGALAGVDPAIMGVGPIASTRKLLDRLNVSMDEVDLFEFNEAFAAQSIAVQRELGIPAEKLNVNGGAVALGHPVGASGCRILVTLLYAMIHRNLTTGLASLCIGGGMGCSTLIRRDKSL